MCERWGLFCIIMLTQIAGHLDAIQIKGIRQNGMTFSGQLIRAQDNFIEFRSNTGNQSQIIGIPFSQVQSLQVTDVPGESSWLVNLEPFFPLLPLFDLHAQGMLIDQLEGLANDEQWSRLYQWTGYLQGIEGEGAASDRITTLRAWALLEMGLRQLAGELLASLESSLDPLEASGLYCWLRARIAIEENLPEEARYWAALPSLRIPAYKGNLSARLEELRSDPSDPKPS